MLTITRYCHAKGRSHPSASTVQATALTGYDAARKRDSCDNSRHTRSTKNTITELLDEALSIEIATPIKSKAKTCFDNPCKAALAIEGALYVQGFLAVPEAPYKPIDNPTLKQYNRSPPCIPKSSQIHSTSPPAPSRTRL